MPRAAIIGTAGHIDHGKTQLIRMLTGVDTDRLKEEKKRGISIELGFTSLTLPSGRKAGIVDVPGHERFIRNMLAGAGGIDLILFVIAADEGVMPQTREHMDIVQLLGVTEGVVALTKVDLVDEDWLELVRSDVNGFLARTALANAPVLEVSSVTGEGRDEMVAMLDRKLDELEVRRRGRFTRLPVDRVFTMSGFGTVVTGTLWGGRLHPGDTVRVLPGDRESRIKSIEVHNEKVEEATAGNRVAVNLHNVSKESVSRGDWLVFEPELEAVEKIDVRLEAIQDLPRPIANRMRVRFYLGAAEVLGRVVLLETEKLRGGESSLAQLQLEAPTVAERGDRFVLRSYSPMRTLGGGTVIDVSERRRRRYREEDLAGLRVAEEGSLEDRLIQIVGGTGGLGKVEGELPQAIGQPPAEIAVAVDALVEEGRLVRVGRGRLVEREELDAAGAALEAAILEDEKTHPLRFGPLKSELKSRFKKTLHGETAEAWIRRAFSEGRLFARGDRLRRSGPELELTPRRRELRARMLADLEERGFAGPTVKEFLEAHGGDSEAPEMLQLMLADEAVYRLPSDILIQARFLAELRVQVRSFFQSKDDLSVAALKELLGVSRKQAVPFLEFMDTHQWTARHGDVRKAGAKLAEAEV